MRPSVYIETTIPSYLTARWSNDVRVLANQTLTLEWWESRKEAFDIYVSGFVVAEAASGNTDAARNRLKAIQDIPQLETTPSVEDLGKRLIVELNFPQRAQLDAYHIAVAAAHGMDYLLTWNCKHIANAALRERIEFVCRDYGYEPPIICTPQELMED